MRVDSGDRGGKGERKHCTRPSRTHQSLRQGPRTAFLPRRYRSACSFTRSAGVLPRIVTAGLARLALVGLRVLFASAA
jgi:hypothetical protein